MAVNQGWAGSSGFLTSSNSTTSANTFVHAKPCNRSVASQAGWALQPVSPVALPSSTSIEQQQRYRIVSTPHSGSDHVHCVDFVGPDGHPELAGALLACNDSAPGQFLFHNANQTLTLAADGRCVDVGGGWGPVVSVGTCNGGKNQQFSFGAAGGLWSDECGGGAPHTARFPRRCMERRTGSPRPDNAKGIRSQVWAKPLLPLGSMAILVINNQAGPSFHGRVEFALVDGMDSARSYAVRDLHKRANLGVTSAGMFQTDEIAEHDSRMLLFTPEHEHEH